MSVYKRMKTLTVKDNNELIESCEDLLKTENGKGRKLTRGEKSRIAAQRRRDGEMVEVKNLMELLPFDMTVLQKLDKISLMEVIINYIRVRHYIETEMAELSLKDTREEKAQIVEKRGTQSIVLNGFEQGKVEESQLMLEAMNGFLIILDRKKKILFISDGVLTHLGIEQIHLLGKKVTTLIHPSDIPELKKQFNLKACSEQCMCKNVNNNKENAELYQIREGAILNIFLFSKRYKVIVYMVMSSFYWQRREWGYIAPRKIPLTFSKKTSKLSHITSEKHMPHLDDNRVFYLRMRCYIKKNGVRTKQTGFVLMQCSGRLKMRAASRSNSYSVDGLICICRPMQTNSIMEISLDGSMFISRHDLGMKFTFCDPRILTLIGYQPEEVIGKTAYQFHNPLDAKRVGDCHSNLIVKGTSVSKYYRFIGKNCEWVWMQTRATIIYNTSNVPQYIVCMNYIISEEEGEQFLRMEEGCNFMPLQAVPAIEAGKSKMDDHHSDNGYWSGQSPYSSVHPSPCSSEGHNASEQSDNGSEKFPTNVFQEVANTIDSDVNRTNEVMEFLQELEQENHNSALLSSQTFQKSNLQGNPLPLNNGVMSEVHGRLENLAAISVESNQSLDNSAIANSNFVCDSNSVIPNQGLNIQIGMLNSSDFPVNSLTEPLPPEITDFCMQYCNSIADDQAQQILAELGQNGFATEIAQFQNNGKPCNISMNESNSMAPSQVSPPVISESQNISMANSPQHPLQIGSQFGVACSTAELQTSMVTPQIDNSCLSTPLSRPSTSEINQLQMCSLNNSVINQPQICTPSTSAMNPPQMCSPNTSYQYPVSPHMWSSQSFLSHQSSPQSYQSACSPLSHHSMSSSACSPMSSACSPQSSVHSPYPYSPSLPDQSSMNIPFCNNSSNISNNQVNGMASPGMLVNSPGASPSPYMQGSPPLKRQNFCSNQTSAASTNSNSSSMSELEKVLRGYSTNNNIFSESSASNGSSKSMLLQKMLTGQLTGESYRAMEKQRKLQSNFSKN